MSGWSQAGAQLLQRLPLQLRRRIVHLQRWLLWAALVVLVVAMLVLQLWLTGRYEASAVQDRIERDDANAAADMRAALGHNLQSLQALQAHAPDPLQWQVRAADLLELRRELVSITWRDAQLKLHMQVESPYRAPQRGADPPPSTEAPSAVAFACANALRQQSPSYADSYFQPMPGGLGEELLPVCLPQVEHGRVKGYVVAVYSLQSMLAELVERSLKQTRELSFTEVDGTRLAIVAAQRRGTRAFTAQQLLSLPGVTLVLRMDGWHQPPSVYPNVLTALVTVMSIALVSVVVVLVRDNRRRLHAERELGEALALRKAMENAQITGLRVRDLQGRITYVNPAFCAMVGYDEQELLSSSSPAVYWPPDRFEEYLQHHAELAAQGTAAPREGYEAQFERKDGTRFAVMIYEAPLLNTKGVQTGWMGAFVDISEQRRVEATSRLAQERLQATARLTAMGEMASLISHELNQPLAAISSYAHGSLNLLQSAGAAPLPAADRSDLDTGLQRIAEQAERAGRVIKSVHAFVRRRSQERSSVTAQALVDAVLPLIRLQAASSAVRLTIDIAPGLPPMLCDVTMVEQVLLNLARNAIQAMAESHAPQRELVLAVRLARGPGMRRWLQWAVRDTGPGIRDEVAAQLFTPLFTTRAEGMGLGLSLCRTVIEQHGGVLDFHARPGGGTAFVFTLPAQ